MTHDKSPANPANGDPMHNPYSAPQTVLSEADFNENTYQPRFFAWHGRLGRVRYLAFMMVGFWAFIFLFGVVLNLFSSLMSQEIDALTLTALGFWTPLLAILLVMSKRRFNDLGHAHWFSLLMLIPIVNLLVFLYLLFAPGQPAPNPYGKPAAPNSTTLVVGTLVLPTLLLLIIGFAAVSAYQNYQKKSRGVEQKQEDYAPGARARDAVKAYDEYEKKTQELEQKHGARVKGTEGAGKQQDE
jgi:uncharacterized membrane protein YhaH (DUF805 family)